MLPPFAVFTAIVRIDAGSLPASGSLSANAPDTRSPLASPGHHVCACAGVPCSAISSPIMFVTPTATATLASPRASSCIASEYAITPASDPPYASGTLIASSPMPPSSFSSASGNSHVSSRLVARGISTRSAYSRAMSRIAACSSVSSNCIRVLALGLFRLRRLVADRERRDLAARSRQAPRRRCLERTRRPVIADLGGRRAESDRLRLAVRPDVQRDRHVRRPRRLVRGLVAVLRLGQLELRIGAAVELRELTAARAQRLVLVPDLRVALRREVERHREVGIAALRLVIRRAARRLEQALLDVPVAEVALAELDARDRAVALDVPVQHDVPAEPAPPADLRDVAVRELLRVRLEACLDRVLIHLAARMRELHTVLRLVVLVGLDDHALRPRRLVRDRRRRWRWRLATTRGEQDQRYDATHSVRFHRVRERRLVLLRDLRELDVLDVLLRAVVDALCGEVALHDLDVLRLAARRHDQLDDDLAVRVLLRIASFTGLRETARVDHLLALQVLLDLVHLLGRDHVAGVIVRIALVLYAEHAGPRWILRLRLVTTTRDEHGQ